MSMGCSRKVIDLIKISIKKNPTNMMTKTIMMEKFKASLNFIMLSKDKVENGLLGESCVKSQKRGENLFDSRRPISTKDSWNVRECWYFGCLTFIGEDYSRR